MYTLFLNVCTMGRRENGVGLVYSFLKPEKDVVDEFHDLDIVTDDGIRLITVSQKLKYLVNLYKKINRL